MGIVYALFICMGSAGCDFVEGPWQAAAGGDLTCMRRKAELDATGLRYTCLRLTRDGWEEVIGKGGSGLGGQGGVP